MTNTAELRRRYANRAGKHKLVFEAADEIDRMRTALEWIKKKTADKRNPAVAFVCEKLLAGEDFSPLR